MMVGKHQKMAWKYAPKALSIKKTFATQYSSISTMKYFSTVSK